MANVLEMENLKKELQGSKGLVQRIRKQWLPTGEILAKEAWKHVSFRGKELSPSDVVTNFNKYLCELIDEEYKLYLKYENSCLGKGAIEIFSKKNIRKDYPFTAGLIDLAVRDLSNTKTSGIKKLSEVGSRLRPFFKLVEQSFAQGRMSRAGGSSQYHLKALLEIAGYKGQFDMQQVLNGTVDLLFPSRKVWDQDRRKCIIVSIKRSLRERYSKVLRNSRLQVG